MVFSIFVISDNFVLPFFSYHLNFRCQIFSLPNFLLPIFPLLFFCCPFSVAVISHIICCCPVFLPSHFSLPIFPIAQLSVCRFFRCRFTVALFSVALFSVALFSVAVFAVNLPRWSPSFRVPRTPDCLGWRGRATALAVSLSIRLNGRHEAAHLIKDARRSLLTRAALQCRRIDRQTIGRCCDADKTLTAEFHFISLYRNRQTVRIIVHTMLANLLFVITHRVTVK